MPPRLPAALATAVLAALTRGGAAAQPVPVPPPPQIATLPPLPAPARAGATPAVPASAASAPAPSRPERLVDKRVIEDEQVRIEETRVRGQLLRVTVLDKASGREYEVLVGPRGGDPMQKRGADGPSGWSVLSF